MEKKKKIVLLAIIISIITIIIMLFIIINQNKEKENFYAIDMNEDVSKVKTVEKEVYFKEYKIIKNCLQAYVDALNLESSAYYGRNENNEFVKSIEEEDIKENIYSMLSENYITKNKITKENVYEYVNTTKENRTIIPIKIYNLNKDNGDVKIYKVSAISIETYNKQEFIYSYFIVNIDEKNSTFSIEPLKNKEDFERVEINYVMSSIEENYINVFSEVKSTQEETIINYFSDYKNILLSDRNLAYDYLDSEYKDKRFKSNSQFESYIMDNKEFIEKSRIEKWSVKYYSDYTQYTCIDQYGRYYIFREKDTLNYSVILDTYTLDLPEFLEKYNSTNENGKVALNIQKFIQAINSKDYNYAYNCLSSGFKDNYFKSVEEFEKYVKENLYNNNEVQYKEFEEESNLYKYTINIIDIDNPNNVLDKTIIMKLNEGTDFEMSFNVN